MPPTDQGETLDTLSPSVTTDTTNPAAPATTPDDTTPTAGSDPLPSSGSGDTPDTTSQPKTMAEAIEAALNAKAPPAKADGDAPDAEGKPGDDKAEGAPAVKPTEDKTGPDDGEELDDPSDEEMRGFRPQVQRRIKQLLSQRNAARKEAEGLQSDAGRYRSIRSFMSENALADAEVADLFKAGADLKSGDPKRLQAFLDRVEPLVQMAREATGKAVPADLQTQVDSGEMTEAAATELARARHAAQMAEARAQRSQTQVDQVNTGARRAQILSAVQAWAQQTSAADPDFALKTDLMRRVAQGIVTERGLPQTPAQAVQFSRDAHAEATRLLRAARPTPQATRPSPTAAASPSRSGVAPAPTSLADVIGRALDA